MSVSEQHRRDLFNGLEDAIGSKEANYLMELLPQSSATELVTRTDMLHFGESLRSELRGDMAELRGEIRGDMAELRAELCGEMAELRGGMAGLRGEIDGKLAAAHSATQRLIVAGMVGNAVAVITTLVA